MKLASPSVGAHVQFAWATSEGFSEGVELGYEVTLLEWKVDTAAQGTELCVVIWVKGVPSKLFMTKPAHYKGRKRTGVRTELVSRASPSPAAQHATPCARNVI